MGDCEILDAEPGGNFVMNDAVGDRCQHAEQDDLGFFHGRLFHKLYGLEDRGANGFQLVVGLAADGDFGLRNQFDEDRGILLLII